MLHQQLCETGGMFVNGTPDPGNMDEIRAKKTKHTRRRRLGIQRMRSVDPSDSLLSNCDQEHNNLSNGSDDCEIKKRRLCDKAAGILVVSGGEVCDVVQEELRSFSISSYGSVSLCGRRRAMEDAVTVAPGLLFSDKLEASYDFFGVYDGHGGCGVAHVCRDRLYRILAQEIEAEARETERSGCDEIDWKKKMECCFSKMDDEISERGIEMENMNSIGSTAVVALVNTEKLIVANCGDSRAVLSRAGVAVPLSHDHKPERPDEMERVEAAGGRVINWNGYRVLGVLATSRSIGDHYLKPYVISVPEVSVTERNEEDEFLILASDGLWDVISNEVACEVVRRCLDGRMKMRLRHAEIESWAAEAAAMLAELAMARGSQDNISAVVVELTKKPR